MPIPSTPRTVYRKNPLEEVICQLRFPTILRIGVDEPVVFQDRVRDRFPFFMEEHVRIAMPEQLSSLLPENLADRIGKAFKFSSEDKAWNLTLARDFLALSTSAYLRWEEFRKRLEGPLVELQKEYSPQFFSRVGLRYRNVIRRSHLGLESSQWAELLQPQIAGELASDVLADIEELAHEMTLRLSGTAKVRIRTGLADSSSTGEVCFVIDCDYFDNEKTESIHAVEKLDEFNRESGRFFRWCITERLHEALGPTPI